MCGIGRVLLQGTQLWVGVWVSEDVLLMLLRPCRADGSKLSVTRAAESASGVRRNVALMIASGHRECEADDDRRESIWSRGSTLPSQRGLWYITLHRSEYCNHYIWTLHPDRV